MTTEHTRRRRFLSCTLTPRGASRFFVKALCLFALLLLPLEARDLREVLKSVEQRYNKAQSLEVQFNQQFTSQGRRRDESGKLSLRKPGRMRWEYSKPAGKLFVSDGKSVWFYSPATGRAQKSRLKDSEDFRAPLAFLLGKLDFSRDFRDYAMTETSDGAVVKALPKNDRMPYTSVEFTVSPANEIRRLVVTGSDASIVEFNFSGERVNAPVKDTAFRFIAPEGAEIVEVEEIGGEERD